MTNPADAQRAQAREIVRYDIKLVPTGYLCVQAEDGDLVLYDDHVEATAALREENAELKEQNAAQADTIRFHLDPHNVVVDPDHYERLIKAEAERDTLREALRRAKPKHYPGECGHCGLDELPPDSCPTLQFIAEIDAALKEPR